jgi:carbon monoxide dehydrogenase subunit G
MPASAEQAWELLRDVEAVASCMPGARITERVDDRHYKGTVGVRFGPANMSFRGEIEVAALEPLRRTLRLVGRGTDSAGGTGASLDLTARVDAVTATSCNLSGNSEVSLSGNAAAFGGRMAEAVAEQVLKQFAGNFAAQLQAREAAGAGGAAATSGTGTASAPAPGSASDAAVAVPRGKSSEQRQLNGLAMLWGVLIGWLRSLFHPRGA